MKVTPTQKKEFRTDEKIKVVHKHWIVYVPSFLIIAAAIWLFFFSISLLALESDPGETALIYGIGLVLIGVSGAILTLGILSIVFWFFNFYQITEEYLLHAHINPRAKFTFKEILIEDISNVGQTRSGFLSALFNFGTVKVSLFNVQGGLFRMNLIKRPHKILTLLNQKINDKH